MLPVVLVATAVIVGDIVSFDAKDTYDVDPLVFFFGFEPNTGVLFVFRLKSSVNEVFIRKGNMVFFFTLLLE